MRYWSRGNERAWAHASWDNGVRDVPSGALRRACKSDGSALATHPGESSCLAASSSVGAAHTDHALGVTRAPQGRGSPAPKTPYTHGVVREDGGKVRR